MAAGLGGAGLLVAATGARALAASDVPQPTVYFGSPAGWSFHDGGAHASASTLLRASGASGALVFFCDGAATGFHLSLDATHRRSREGRDEGLLKVYALDADAQDTPLGQFRVRFLSATDLRSAPLRQPEWDHPARLREIVERHGAGLRLVTSLVRQGEFLPARVADLHLPDGTDGSAIPMEAALDNLDRACRTGLKLHGEADRAREAASLKAEYDTET